MCMLYLVHICPTQACQRAQVDSQRVLEVVFHYDQQQLHNLLQKGARKILVKHQWRRKI